MNFPKIAAEEAYKTCMANKFCKTPRQDTKERLIPFAAPNFEPSFEILPGESVFTMGSCFARYIESFLAKKGFTVPVSTFFAPPEECHDVWPAGPSLFTMFTPFSMLNKIRFAVGDVDPKLALIEVPGGYLDLQLHTDKPVTYERAVERHNEIYQLVKNALKNSRIAVVTLGLVEAWFDNQNQIYTNHTPSIQLVRANPGRYSFEALSPETVFGAVDDLIALMKRHGHPEQRLLLTVSPVPLGRTFTAQDAMTANAYSKAVLRTAAEIAVRKYDHVDYFPSYESVTLSERETTWEPDGLHVKAPAVQFNVDNMLKSYCKDVANAPQ